MRTANIVNFAKRRLRPLKRSLQERVKATHSKILLNWILHWSSQPFPVNASSSLIFAPHPDDETLGCGGLIALRRHQQASVKVVVLTDGQSSHTSVSTIQPTELGEARKRETVAALAVLGVEPTHLYFLDQPDGSLQSLQGEARQSLIQQLVDLIRAFQPQDVFIPHAKDRHADHEATFALVLEAIAQSRCSVQVFQYPIWLFWDGLLGIDYQLSDLAGAQRLDVTQTLSQKQQALQAYRSQLCPLSPDSVSALPPDFLKQFSLAYEVYFKLSHTLPSQYSHESPR
jgi:N-acetylglucosamine malate deacetylase 1